MYGYNHHKPNSAQKILDGLSGSFEKLYDRKEEIADRAGTALSQGAKGAAKAWENTPNNVKIPFALTATTMLPAVYAAGNIALESAGAKLMESGLGNIAMRYAPEATTAIEVGLATIDPNAPLTKEQIYGALMSKISEKIIDE